jgi:GTPase involved in cell partitioning and DNA repair
MKLYELSTQYAHLVDMLEAAQLDETQDVELLKDTLDAIEEAIEEKADNISRIMNELQATEEAIKAEVDRLVSRSAMIKKQRESLKRYLQSAMESVGKDKFKTSFYSYTIKNNPPSVQILDESLIPSELIREKVERSPDKKAIAESLKANQEVAGCVLQQSKTLVIK